jgi:hypothetical protein
MPNDSKTLIFSERSKKFVRLYPVSLRFLTDDKVFKKYQWITAKIRKAIRDPRPESYNINTDTIQPGEILETKKSDWSARALWITIPAGHVFPSVEALQTAQSENGTSIGMVKPAIVTDVIAVPFSRSEQDEFWSKSQEIAAQQQLFDMVEDKGIVRTLPAPQFRFQIQFHCDDSACTKDHCLSVFDWEVDALFNRLRVSGVSRESARDEVIAKLRNEVCGAEKDTHFFLGNMAAYPQSFTIVGLWYPPRQSQLELFAGRL